MVWLVGSAYDLFFFIPLWFIAAYVCFSPSLIEFFGASIFSLWFYHLFIRLPHFAAGYDLAFSSKWGWTDFRSKIIERGIIPLAILMVFVVPFLLGMPSNHPLVRLSTGVAIVWGIQHIGMQNFGILRLYRRRESEVLGIPADSWSGKSEKAILYILILKNIEKAFFSLIFEPSWLNSISFAIDAAILLSISAYLLALGISKPSRQTLGPGTLHFLTSIAVMFPWTFYPNRIDHFLVFNGHHSIAYLGLLFLIRQKGDLREAIRLFPKFMVPFVAMSLVAILIVKFGIGENPLNSRIFLGLFTVHYYLESVIWRSSGRLVVPLLRQRSPALVAS